jgi:chemosensory pili system protein ChpE
LSHANDFVAGAALSLSNPNNLTFWLGMSGTIIGLGFLNPQPSHLAMFFVGFMTAQVCWCFLFAGLVRIGQEFVTPAYFRRVNFACAAILAFLGIRLLIETLIMVF